MEFNKLFKVNMIETEIKRIENVIFDDATAVALKVRDKTIEDVSSLFETIVTTIEYDITAIKKGLMKIEEELVSLVEKRSQLEDNKQILLSHHSDLESVLANAEKTALSISDIKDSGVDTPVTTASPTFPNNDTLFTTNTVKVFDSSN